MKKKKLEKLSENKIISRIDSIFAFLSKRAKCSIDTHALVNKIKKQQKEAKQLISVLPVEKQSSYLESLSNLEKEIKIARERTISQAQEYNNIIKDVETTFRKFDFYLAKDKLSEGNKKTIAILLNKLNLDISNLKEVDKKKYLSKYEDLMMSLKNNKNKNIKQNDNWIETSSQSYGWIDNNDDYMTLKYGHVSHFPLPPEAYKKYKGKGSTWKPEYITDIFKEK